MTSQRGGDGEAVGGDALGQDRGVAAAPADRRQRARDLEGDGHPEGGRLGEEYRRAKPGTNWGTFEKSETKNLAAFSRGLPSNY